MKPCFAAQVGCVALFSLLTSSGADAKPILQLTPDCTGHYDRYEAYIANASPGDIVLTRKEDSPAGAVTDPLGQYYTHTGIMLGTGSVRHNTAVVQNRDTFSNTLDQAVQAIVSVFDSSVCYGWAEVPYEQMRSGEPGLFTSSVSDMPSAASQPWEMQRLDLLKPSPGTDVGQRAAAAIRGIGDLNYDVYSYRSYEGGLLNGGSTCSGSVKYALDQSGVGGFDLVDYTEDMVHTSAQNLFDYVYRRARDKIDAKTHQNVLGVTFYSVNDACRDRAAAGVANQVVSCFTDGSCDRGGSKDYAQSLAYWGAAPLGTATSISPDNLLYGQANSRYTGGVVRADYHGVRYEWVPPYSGCTPNPGGPGHELP